MVRTISKGRTLEYAEGMLELAHGDYAVPLRCRGRKHLESLNQSFIEYMNNKSKQPSVTGQDVTMTDLSLVILLRQAAEIGGRRALIGAGLESPTIRRKEAITRYGQNDIDRWQKEGLVKPIHDGYRSGYRYSVIELMSAALQSNRKTYLSVAERREK